MSSATPSASPVSSATLELKRAATSSVVSITYHEPRVSERHLVLRPSMSALSFRSGRTSASQSSCGRPAWTRMPLEMPVHALNIFALMSASLPPPSAATTSRPEIRADGAMNMYGHANAYTHDTPRESCTYMTVGTSSSSVCSLADRSR